MSMLVDLPFVVTRRPPPRDPPAAVTSEVARNLSNTYGKDDAVCVLIDGWDDKRISRLRHNLVNVGHKATPKFGVTTRQDLDGNGRRVLFAWAREPRPPRKKRVKP